MDEAASVFCEKCRCILAQGDTGIVWDDRQLCETCFAAEFEDEFGELALYPQETIRVGLAAALARGFLSAIVGTTMIAGILFTMFLLIRLAYQLSQLGAGKPFAAAELQTWLYFLAFAWFFCGVVTIPLILGWSLTSLTRTIHVADGQLIQETLVRTVKIPFTQGVWYECPSGFEGGRALLWRRPLVGIHNRDNANDAVVCGFTDQTRRLWTGYFIRMVHRPVAAISKARVFLNCLRGLALGGAAGLVVGGTIHAVTGYPMWITALTFLGFLDGLAWAVFDVALKAGSAPHVAAYFKSNPRMMPVSMIVTSALLGLKIGVLLGFPGALACSLINAFAGTLGWLWIRTHLQRLTMQLSSHRLTPEVAPATRLSPPSQGGAEGVG